MQTFPRIPNANISYQQSLPSCDQPSNRGNRNSEFNYGNFVPQSAFHALQFQQKQFLNYMNPVTAGHIPPLRGNGQLLRPMNPQSNAASCQFFRQGMTNAVQLESLAAGQNPSAKSSRYNKVAGGSPEIPDPTPTTSPRKAGTQSAYQLLQKLYQEERENNVKAKEQMNSLINENMAKEIRIEELESLVKTGADGERAEESAEIVRLKSENSSYKQKLEEMVQNAMRSPTPTFRHHQPDGSPPLGFDTGGDIASRYKAERDALEKGLTGAHNRIKALKNELESSKNKLAEADMKLLEAETEKTTLQVQIQEWKQKSDSSADESQNATENSPSQSTDSENLQDITEEIQKLKAEKDQLESEISKLSDQIHSGTSEAYSSKVDTKNLQLLASNQDETMDRASMMEQISKLKHAIHVYSTENSSLKLQSDKLKISIQALQTQNEELQNLNWESEELEVTKAEKKKLEEKYTTVLTEMEALKIQISSAETSTAKQIETLEQDISDLKAQLGGLELENSDLLRELEQLGSSPQDRKEALGTLQETAKNYESLKEELTNSQDEVTKLQSENNDLDKKAKDLENRLESKTQKLKEKNHLLQKEKTTKATELKKLRDSLLAAHERETELSTQLSNANKSLETSEFRMIEMEKSLEAILKRKHTLFKERQSNCKEISRLKDIEKDLNKELEDLQEKYGRVLEATSDGQCDAFKKTLRKNEEKIQQWKRKFREAEGKLKDIESKLHQKYFEQIGKLEEKVQEVTAEKNILENENANFWKDSTNQQATSTISGISKLGKRKLCEEDAITENEEVANSHDETGIQDEEEELIQSGSDSTVPPKICRLDSNCA